MYRLAYRCNDEKIVYYDLAGNKYIASGGNLAWRINNPGLIYSHSHFSRKFGSIGSCKPYSIFSTPQKGRQALAAWLHSNKAGGEAVWSMPNDTALFGLKDGAACVVLKLTLDTPIVDWAAKYFRYLLNLSDQDSNHSPVIIFVHSQGAIISEHVLELLNKKERKRIRIFTFGAGSFIEPGKSHSDTHNFASAADFVCPIGSPNLHYYALQRYYGGKDGLNEEQVMSQLAYQDALLDLDSIDLKVVELYTQKRMKYYEKEFSRISNVTVLDPDPDSRWKHKFSSLCYQSRVHEIIKKYQRKR